MNSKRVLLIVAFFHLSTALAQVPLVAFDDERPKLSPRFGTQESPIDDESYRGLMQFFSFQAQPPLASDLNQVFQYLTPVKSQGNRGTCSIFSAIAILESLLIKEKGAPLATTDLSEEWLAYHATYLNRDEGSSAYTNVRLIRDEGFVTEAVLPYEPEGWDELDVSQNSKLAKRCGMLRGTSLKLCKYAHRAEALKTLNAVDLNDPKHAFFDPDFLKARISAPRNQSKFLGQQTRYRTVRTVTEVKSLLAQGIPLLLEFDFYYGAWNHREADDIGIGRNSNAFSLGLVGFPEPGSLDERESPKHPAGHSVMVVGYDDQKVVTTEVKMIDGSIRKFTYKGVYYFKNSWGTAKFGSASAIRGPTPGYGTMTQKYGNQIGTFYKVDL